MFDLDLQIRKAYNLSVKAEAKLKIGSFTKIIYLGSYEIFKFVNFTFFKVYLVFFVNNICKSHPNRPFRSN